MTDCPKAGYFPRRKHLRRLDRVAISGPPVFFLTVCVYRRHHVLAEPSIAGILIEGWRHAKAQHGWLVGRYVVMPDHVHFFASPLGEGAKELSRLLNYWKRSTAIRIRRAGVSEFRWQREFFDHLLRSDESYAGEWDYVRDNPVRANLVGRPEEWPYQGEVNALGV